jgi:hypothetical protein
MGSERVHFRETQTLKQDDLSDDQAYQIQIRRRHNIAQHGWGIVRGLQLVLDQGKVFLTPGFAIDGYGRELIVDKRIDFKDELFQRLLEHESEGKRGAYYAVDVWLNYRALIHQPDEYSIAQEMFKGTGRVCEEAWLKILCADPQSAVNPYRPPGVAEADLNLKPGDALPVDSGDEWPVYLGRIELFQNADNLSYELPIAERPYAALVGAGISAPWNGSWMQIGASIFSDKNRFSVVLPDADGSPVRRMSLDKDSNAVFNGNVKFQRHSADPVQALGQVNLEFDDHHGVSGPALGFTAADSIPEAAAAWKIYRADLEKDPEKKQQKTQQLRFEIFNPGDEGDPTLSQWMVGGEAKTIDGTLLPFSPVLNVRADGTVVVAGSFEVNGRVIDGPIPLDFNDPRFRDELLSRWSKGLTTAGQEVDAFYAVILDVELVFLDGGTQIAIEALKYNTNYNIQLIIRNVSRELTARLLQIEFAVEYFSRGTTERTLFQLPDGPEMSAGEIRDYDTNTFSFSKETGITEPEKAQVSLKITTAGISQNTTEALHSVDIFLSTPP